MTLTGISYRSVLRFLGQFICGEKRCDEKEHLRSWEVLFGYVEHGKKRDALVKLSKHWPIEPVPHLFVHSRTVSCVYKETSLRP